VSEKMRVIERTWTHSQCPAGASGSRARDEPAPKRKSSTAGALMLWRRTRTPALFSVSSWLIRNAVATRRESLPQDMIHMFHNRHLRPVGQDSH
jgi:hypothetical protein